MTWRDDYQTQEAGSGHTQFEFRFTLRDFRRIREMILARAGISLAPHKQSMVYSRLSKRVRSLGLQSFREYLELLEVSSEAEWEIFTNALTTNLTSFFREAHHFDILRDFLLQAAQRKPHLNIWCCASSTGEEPYSLAMTAIDTFGTYDPPVRILASDIDTQVLQAAEKGIYRTETVEHLEHDVLKRHFLRGAGSQEGLVRVKPAVQALVSFRRVNLLDPVWQVNGPFDAIFCRNVMIYFDRDVQLQILERFAPLIRSGGLLFAGHSENFSMARAHFELRGKTVYERVACGEAP